MSRDPNLSTSLRRFTKALGDLPTATVTWFFSDTATLYDVLGRQPGVGNYLNLGWWNTTERESIGEDDITSACEELVRQFAYFGEIDPADRILDVGFGFGQQDVLLAEEFDCRDITGINITSHHVREGRNLIDDHGLSDRVKLHRGDAVNLPFDDGRFDTIFALETAFHFHTRQDFFDEARRVLKPGGKLLTADIIDGPKRTKGGLLPSLLSRAHEAYWNIPHANRVDTDGYRRSLTERGFRDVTIRDVSPNVLEPWVRNYLPWRLEQQPVPFRWLGKPIVNKLVDFYESDYFRYVFCKALRPSGE